MEGAARRATIADEARLADLYEQALEHMTAFRGGDLFVRREARPSPAGAALTAALGDITRSVLVGTIDDVAVGYALGRIETLRDGGRLGVIEDLYVEEEGRGVAVGEAMISLLLEWMQGEGCFGVDAFALPGDRNTKNFFETNGFTARLLRMHHRIAG